MNNYFHVYDLRQFVMSLIRKIAKEKLNKEKRKQSVLDDHETDEIERANTSESGENSSLLSTFRLYFL